MNQERIWSRRGAAYAGSDTHRASGTLDGLPALLRPVPSYRCLDLGSGAGHTAARLAEIAAEVVALDPAHIRAYTLEAWRSMIEASPLTWVVGDGLSSEQIEVDSWLARLERPAAAETEVRRLLRTADRAARALFGIRYGSDGEASHFVMPVAAILAVKEER